MQCKSVLCIKNKKNKTKGRKAARGKGVKRYKMPDTREHVKSALKHYTIAQPKRYAEGGETVDVYLVLTDPMMSSPWLEKISRLHFALQAI